MEAMFGSLWFGNLYSPPICLLLRLRRLNEYSTQESLNIGTSHGLFLAPWAKRTMTLSFGTSFWFIAQANCGNSHRPSLLIPVDRW